MTGEDVRVLANEVLRPTLGPVGFTSAEVEVGENDVGEDAFFVKVHFKPGSRAADGRVYNDALWNMWNALRSRGEQRYAHLLWSYAEDHADKPDPGLDSGSAE